MIIEEIARKPVLMLFAVDRIEIMAERIGRLRQRAAHYGTVPHIEKIHAGDDIFGRSSVRLLIEALPRKYQNGHVVVFVTHAGLMSADLSGFEGWELVIDEAPSVFELQSVQSEVSAPFFASWYRLEPMTDKWSKVTALDESKTISVARFANDQFHRDLQVFHRRVISPRVEVCCNLTTWADMGRPKTEWSWWSLWGPDQLEAFDRVLLLGNNLDRSVMMRLWGRRFTEIVWTPYDIKPWREPARRSLVIHYFAEAHEATRTLFDDDLGVSWLRAIGQEIAKRTNPVDLIWTCNKPEKSVLGASLPCDAYLRPQQAGTNGKADRTQAAIIYSAKANKQERAVFAAMGIDPYAIQETRELEVILQFVTRTAVRDPDSTAPLTFFVYDGVQAKFLREYFERAGYVDVTLDLIDLGFAHEVRNTKDGRPKLVLTPEEARARDEERRERDRAKKARQRERQRREAIEAGIHRGRGRPRKAA